MELQGQNIYLVTGIPTTVKTSDFRRIFSESVEAGAFTCFHYRHRPVSSRATLPNHQNLDVNALLHVLKQHRSKRHRECTALIAVNPTHAKRFFASFEDSWTTDEKVGDLPPCRFHSVTYTPSQLSSLEKLCEFTPPSWMPRGNVGTPTSHFFLLIRSCQLGSDIIRRLGLDLTRFNCNRKYGSVPYQYAAVTPQLESDRTMGTGLNRPNLQTKYGLILSNPVNMDEIVEEWDRFEVLHNDPYNVDRSGNHSLKYESKVELKWEKGGSGLVHYTDEMFWRERESVRKDEFFDEPSSFDWDINTNHYDDEEGLSFTGPGGPDLDIKQLNEILDESNVCCAKPYLSLYATKIMKKQGWRKGHRLGHPKRKGLLEPLTSDDGLVSTNRSGLGFHEASLRPHLHKSIHKPESSVYIRSVFDSPEVVALRSATSYPEVGLPQKRNSPDCQSFNRRNRFVINNPHNILGIEAVKFKFGGIVG